MMKNGRSASYGRMNSGRDSRISSEIKFIKSSKRGKSPAVIADELELEPEVVETLIQELRKELFGSVL